MPGVILNKDCIQKALSFSLVTSIFHLDVGLGQSHTHREGATWLAGAHSVVHIHTASTQNCFLLKKTTLQHQSLLWQRLQHGRDPRKQKRIGATEIPGILETQSTVF